VSVLESAADLQPSEWQSPEKRYLPPAAILKAQFNDELQNAHDKFLQLLHSLLSRCLVRRGDDGLLYDGRGFEILCSRLSFTLQSFCTDTERIHNNTWRKYLTTVTSAIKQNNELMGVVAMMSWVAKSRFDKQTDSEVGTKFHARFLELNGLRLRLQQIDDLRQRSAKSIEQDLRIYYNRFLADLRVAISRQKKRSEGAKRKVYDDVLLKINRAKTVALKLRSPAELETVRDSEPLLDERFIVGIKESNDEIRREIVMRRICRCLNEVAVRSRYCKRIDRVERERCIANTALWSHRIQYNAEHVGMGQRLYDAHQQLSVAQASINHLKTQLENEKLGNIQLVHWKANNLKVIEGLQREIMRFRGADEMDIDRLLSKLEPAEAELGELTKFGDEFERAVREDVGMPVEQIMAMREEMKVAKHAASEAATMTMSRSRSGVVARVREENERLRGANLEMRGRIEVFEATKQTKPVAVKAFMEETLLPPPTRPKTRIGGKIKRPALPARAGSRM
jgi:hypothetical protein